MTTSFHPDPAAVYLCDNGMALCGTHLGVTAKTTGRDISDQPIYRVTPADLAAEGMTSLKCECCAVAVAV